MTCSHYTTLSIHRKLLGTKVSIHYHYYISDFKCYNNTYNDAQHSTKIRGARMMMHGVWKGKEEGGRRSKDFWCSTT